MPILQPSTQGNLSTITAKLPITLKRDLPISLKSEKYFYFLAWLLHFIILFHRISASKKYWFLIILKQKLEQPKTIELTHEGAINLFNDLESNCLQASEKKILRSAVNFHRYLEEQLKKPGLRLKDIRALFGIKFDVPNANDSSEDSDASDDQSNKDNKMQ